MYSKIVCSAHYTISQFVSQSIFILLRQRDSYRNTNLHPVSHCFQVIADFFRQFFLFSTDVVRPLFDALVRMNL